ncbi:hypothetical protein ACWWJF_14535 [Symbiopectobacterium sp. Eva_TO]
MNAYSVMLSVRMMQACVIVVRHVAATSDKNSLWIKRIETVQKGKISAED